MVCIISITIEDDERNKKVVEEIDKINNKSENSNETK